MFHAKAYIAHNAGKSVPNFSYNNNKTIATKKNQKYI